MIRHNESFFKFDPIFNISTCRTVFFDSELFLVHFSSFNSISNGASNQKKPHRGQVRLIRSGGSGLERKIKIKEKFGTRVRFGWLPLLAAVPVVALATSALNFSNSTGDRVLAIKSSSGNLPLLAIRQPASEPSPPDRLDWPIYAPLPSVASNRWPPPEVYREIGQNRIGVRPIADACS